MKRQPLMVWLAVLMSLGGCGHLNFLQSQTGDSGSQPLVHPHPEAKAPAAQQSPGEPLAHNAAARPFKRSIRSAETIASTEPKTEAFERLSLNTRILPLAVTTPAWFAQAPSRAELLVWVLLALLCRSMSRRWQERRMWRQLQVQIHELQQLTVAAPGRFHAMLAHELRQPVAALFFQVEQLRLQPMAARAKLRVHRVQQGLQRVSRLLEQLLSLSRAQLSPAAREPQPNIQHSCVQEVLRQVLEELMPQLQKRQHEISLMSDHDVWVRLPAFDLYTLLRNLLDNAMRYSHEGGSINILLSHRRDQVRIQLADEGPGIPQTELERVFDPFYRIDGKATGSGLGLSIVRTIVEQAKGSIHLSNRTEGGLLVTLHLPAAKAGARPEIDARRLQQA